jgi:hypothetical protein
MSKKNAINVQELVKLYDSYANVGYKSTAEELFAAAIENKEKVAKWVGMSKDNADWFASFLEAAGKTQKEFELKAQSYLLLHPEYILDFKWQHGFLEPLAKFKKIAAVKTERVAKKCLDDFGLKITPSAPIVFKKNIERAVEQPKKEKNTED